MTAIGPHIARIELHKVRSGESLESLAGRCGITWQRLAEFNWGTSSPPEINEHLRDDVGCTQRTPGGNYRFADADNPGIVALFRKWSQDGLATEQTHTFRVTPVPGLRLWVRVDIDPDDATTHDDRFVLTSPDWGYRSTKTVRDDHVPGDDSLDLRYSGLRRDARYTLEAFPGEGEPSVVLFSNVPYDELAGLSPAAPDEEDTEEVAAPGEDDPYPDDPDEQDDLQAGAAA